MQLSSALDIKEETSISSPTISSLQCSDSVTQESSSASFDSSACPLEKNVEKKILLQTERTRRDSDNDDNGDTGDNGDNGDNNVPEEDDENFVNDAEAYDNDDDGETDAKGERLSRGKWTVEEDETLREAVDRHEGKNWKKISDCLEGRTDVQCLHRSISPTS